MGANQIFLIRSKDTYFIFISILLSVTFSIILSFYFESFPDYSGYNRYVTDLSSLERFRREILSAYLMYCIGVLGGGGVDYYFICTLFLFLSFSFYCYKNQLLSVLTLSFLCLNPIMLILLHVPRFTMSLGFLMLALSTDKRNLSLFWLVLGLFSHSILGLFSILVYSSQFLKAKYIVLSIALSALVFLMILFGILDTPYSQYLVAEHDRGRFRLLLFIALLILYFSMLKRKLSERFYLTLLSIFTISLYLLSPFAHRFIIVFFILVSIEIERANMRLFNRIVWGGFKLTSLMGTILIFYLGLYQYEIIPE